ncbi:MAG: hypothetical protein AB1646_11680 [Thermodesulfobacteriota bacterium]
MRGGIYRRLFRLGRVLFELFVLAIGTAKVGESLTDEEGVVFGYLLESGCKYLSVFGAITIGLAHYRKAGRQGSSRWTPG